MTKIAVVGAGWRADFYLRIAQMMSENFEIVGVVARKEQVRSQVHEKYNVPTFASIDELLKIEKPDFAVSSVSWDSNPLVVQTLVQAGVFVLSETPPAPTVEALEDLWRLVGSSEMVQVAEQYLYLPGHSTRLALVKNGVIGQPTSVEVSSTHGYHAISIMRGFMDAGFEETSIVSRRFDAPLVDPLKRGRWNSDMNPQQAGTTISLVDFGGNKSGIYNFVDNLWHNQLRHRRIVIRGSKGEIVDDRVIRLIDGPAIVSSEIKRYQLGYDLNLDGFDTEHLSFDGEVLFKNPFVGLRLMDEEIAIATLMVAMADWINGNAPAPYPLRQGCQDQYLSLAIDESLKTGETVIAKPRLWAK